MDRSAGRSAESEARFRRANEQIKERAADLAPADQPSPYLCECDDEGCTTVVPLTLNEYEAVRAQPRQFVLAPGHERPDDRVLAEQERFTVVEKTGEKGRLVEESDPRR